jgi:hypothetical protein
MPKHVIERTVPGVPTQLGLGDPIPEGRTTTPKGLPARTITADTPIAGRSQPLELRSAPHETAPKLGTRALARIQMPSDQPTRETAPERRLGVTPVGCHLRRGAHRRHTRTAR